MKSTRPLSVLILVLLVACGRYYSTEPTQSPPSIGVLDHTVQDYDLHDIDEPDDSAVVDADYDPDIESEELDDLVTPIEVTQITIVHAGEANRTTHEKELVKTNETALLREQMGLKREQSGAKRDILLFAFAVIVALLGLLVKLADD